MQNLERYLIANRTVYQQVHLLLFKLRNSHERLRSFGFPIINLHILKG